MGGRIRLGCWNPVVKLGGSPRFIVSTPPAPEDVRHVDLQKREWGFGDVLLGHWALVTWCATVLRCITGRFDGRGSGREL